MQEIALLNPKRRRVTRRKTVRRRAPVRTRTVYKNPKRKYKRRTSSGIPSVSSIKGIFSKKNLENWAYLGGGFMVGVAAEKSFGEKISNMISGSLPVNIPVINTFIKQVPLILGLTMFGKGLPKAGQTGMQAYIGYRLVNSALQMANINLSGLGDIGYTPQFGLSGIYEPTSGTSQMSGIYEPITSGTSNVFEPSF